jgi:hypothetical protein
VCCVTFRPAGLALIDMQSDIYAATAVISFKLRRSPRFVVYLVTSAIYRPGTMVAAEA